MHTLFYFGGKENEKTVLAILIFVICLSLAACGGGNYTINLPSGSTESMSAKGFIDLKQNNQLKYSKEYEGCSISGSGKITKIESGVANDFYYYTLEYSYYTITINDEIVILTLEEYLPSCEVGDTVAFKAEVQDVKMGDILLFNQNEKVATITKE